MSEELRDKIASAVVGEDKAELCRIVEVFSNAGNKYSDIFAVFKMACPWLDKPEFETLMQLAEEGASL